MGACYLRALRPEWEVDSAGVRAVSGRPASKRACEAVREMGLSLDAHRSQSIEALKGRSFDLVLAMTEEHLQCLKRWEEARLLSSLRGEAQSIEDPFGGTLADYRSSLNQIKYYIDGIKNLEYVDS